MTLNMSMTARLLRPWWFLALLGVFSLTERAGISLGYSSPTPPLHEDQFAARHPRPLAWEFVVTPCRAYTRYTVDDRFYFFAERKLVLVSASPLPTLP